MTKALAYAFALLVALAPAINDVCGLNCATPVAATCPLHHETPAPEKCAHNHGVLRADVVRTHSQAPMLQLIAIVATPLLVRPSNSFDSSSIVGRREPAFHPASPLVLRI